MSKLNLSVFSQKEMETVHERSLEYLQNHGFHLNHEGGREILAAAGAEITDNLVKLPRRLVNKALDTVPHQISFYDRQGRNPVTLNDGTPHTRVNSGVENYLDIDEKFSRPATTEDTINLIRLVDALDYIEICNCPYPHDVPANVHDVYNVFLMLQHTTKPVWQSIFSRKNLEYIIEMALVVRGSGQALQEKPLFSFLVSPTSPLQLHNMATDTLLLAGEYMVPIDVATAPISGATGPVTLAGMLLQSNIEFLMTVVLSQIANPGAPLIYGARGYIMDLKTTQILQGTVENAMLSMASSQLASEFYDLPVSTRGGNTDSHQVDGQSAIEHAINMFMTMAAGSSLTNVGVVETSMSLSPLQLVIDNQICAMVRKAMGGIAMDSDSLGFDALAAAGPGGVFMSCNHTIKYFRQAVLDIPIFDRQFRDDWLAGKQPDFISKTKETTRVIIANHHAEPLEEKMFQELNQIKNTAFAGIS